MTLKSWWTPVTEENSSAIRQVSLRCLRHRRYLRKAQSWCGVKVCPSAGQNVFWGLRGFQTPTVWTRSFQSFPSTENVEHAGEKTTTSSACGGTAVSGWKRAISVVFWWSPRPQRNALSLVLQSGVENINTGLPEDKTHTPACKPWCNPWYCVTWLSAMSLTLCAASLSALSRVEQ